MPPLTVIHLYQVSETHHTLAGTVDNVNQISQLKLQVSTTTKQYENMNFANKHALPCGTASFKLPLLCVFLSEANRP